VAAPLTDSNRLALSEVYENWARARHADVWHDVAFNRLAALHDETRGLDPEPSRLKITLIGARLAQIDALQFLIPTSVGNAMSRPRSGSYH
jgi:hypothetical protein